MIVILSPVFIFTSIVSLCIYIGLLSFSSRAQKKWAWAACVFHGLSLVSLLMLFPHRWGFAIALSVSVWVVLTLYLIESYIYTALQLRKELYLLGAGVQLLSLYWPASLKEVESSVAATVHGVLGLVAYALVATAVFHAWLMQRSEKAMRECRPVDTGLALLSLERLTFRFLGLGVLFLSLTLLMGAFFTTGHWVWAWDHKTIFALGAWLMLSLVLISHYWRGFRGKKAILQLYLGALLLLLSYSGSRFVSEVIFHHV